MPADKQSVSLTERAIRDAKPGTRARILWDRTVKGFGVKIQPGGTMSFIIDYRVSGRQRRATLARVGELSLKDARERAGAELASIRAGEADPLSRRSEAMAAPTVAEAVARFFREYAPERIARGRMTQRTVTEYGKQAKAIILPALGRERVAEVKRFHVEDMVRKLPPSQRNRTLALTSRLFTLFEHWELRPQRTNPARGIERALERPRDRTLTTDELATLHRALRARIEDYPAVIAAITVAAVTGLRIGEVLAMQWQHVDSESGRLFMPETKTGQRTHHLPAAALDVLERLPHVHGNPWCFTLGRNAPVGYKLCRPRLRGRREGGWPRGRAAS